MAREEDAGWSNPRVLVIFAVIFLCGTSFGAVLMSEYMHTHVHLPETSAGTMDAASKLGLERLKSQLDLTDSQQQTVMGVLDEYGKFYQNIEDERQDVARHGERRILDCLTEPQKQKFQKMLGIKKSAQ
jgi:hypothetical protein